MTYLGLAFSILGSPLCYFACRHRSLFDGRTHYSRSLSGVHNASHACLGEGLLQWCGPPPQRGSTGLYHLAIAYSTRAELADALRRLLRARIPLEGASDHGVSEALYLRDPDGNGVELYWDRPREEWPHKPNGDLAMVTKPLDLNQLLREGDQS